MYTYSITPANSTLGETRTLSYLSAALVSKTSVSTNSTTKANKSKPGGSNPNLHSDSVICTPLHHGFDFKTISRGSEIRTHTSPLGERTVFKTVSGTLYSLWEPLYKVALNGIEPLSLESKSSVLSHYTWQGNKKERVVRIELTSKAWKAIIITIILYPHIPVSPDLSPYPVLFNFGRLRSHRRTSYLRSRTDSNRQRVGLQPTALPIELQLHF